ncbi:MAG: response regulator [candidate division Zixibacteria bacterium]|nr:response regulator [candidate division Zixibacteria bacterium]
MTTDTVSKVNIRKGVLVVDSIAGPLVALSGELTKLNCQVFTSFSYSEALKEITESQPKVILVNITGDTKQAFEFLRDLQGINSNIPVVVTSEQTSAESAIQVMKFGAYEYLPLDGNHDKIIGIVNNIVNKSDYTKALGPVHFRERKPDTQTALIGNSPEMVEIAKLIGQVASSDASVLIMGESGTGKELVAKLIYENSDRSDKPFLSVNSAAIPDTLLESELFGHEKGAFTGAFSKKLGKFELCNGGTIFLDEIADMSLSTQSKILRVLQQQEFERLGGTQNIKVDVRVITATNKSLVRAIKENKFRVDLFYRLKVVSIYIPPLRDRKNDIPLLIDHFLEYYCRECSRSIEGVNPDAVKQLMQYPWPGNVRELENNIHTAVVMCKEHILQPEHFPILSEKRESVKIDPGELEEDYTKMFDEVIRPTFDKIAVVSEGNVYEHIMSAVEKALYSEALRYCGSNQVKASNLLGVSRNTLRDRVKKFGLY